MYKVVDCTNIDEKPLPEKAGPDVSVHVHLPLFLL